MFALLDHADEGLFSMVAVVILTTTTTDKLPMSKTQIFLKYSELSMLKFLLFCQPIFAIPFHCNLRYETTLAKPFTEVPAAR